MKNAYGDLKEVSIHAPVKGATARTGNKPRTHSSFNPRSCERSDIGTVIFAALIFSFNPRSCERSDLNSRINLKFRYKFQSTLL